VEVWRHGFQEVCEAKTDTAVVALVVKLVLLYEEIPTGLGLVPLAVTTQRATTIVQIRTLSLESLELRRHHSNEFMVDEKSQLTDPITNIIVYTIVYNTNAWESSVCVDIGRILDYQALQ